jgi:LPS export ABC transporter protein LptC
VRLVGVGMLVFMAGCGRQEAGPTASAGFRKLPSDQVIVGFEQHMTESGKNKAVLRGDTAYVFEDSSFAKLRKVNLTLYDEQGQLSARLNSDSGDVNTFTRAMVARGKVVLITEQDGRRIETEELHFDPQAHRVWSTVRTVQHHQGGVLTGTGFEADDKFYNVRITNARSSGGGFRITF